MAQEVENIKREVRDAVRNSEQKCNGDLALAQYGKCRIGASPWLAKACSVLTL